MSESVEQPAPGDMHLLSAEEAEHLYEDLALPLGVGRPYIATNTVVTVDGKTAFEGRSTPIGSRFDRRVMQRIRAAADAVIMGAGSLRAEEVEFRLPPSLLEGRPTRGLPAALTVVVVTARGDLPLARRLFAQPTPEVTPVVLTCRAGENAVHRDLPAGVEVLVAGDDDVDLPAAVRALFGELGLRHAILEGGPSLNAAMLAVELVDEIFFTLSPKVLGGPALTMVAGPAVLPGGLRRLALRSALAYGDELFLRYRVQHAST
ncbi:MAG: RibD family protein [Chloroflexota bacterium]